jgi:hypothetical protein
MDGIGGDVKGMDAKPSLMQRMREGGPPTLRVRKKKKEIALDSQRAICIITVSQAHQGQHHYTTIGVDIMCAKKSKKDEEKKPEPPAPETLADGESDLFDDDPHLAPLEEMEDLEDDLEADTVEDTKAQCVAQWKIINDLDKKTEAASKIDAKNVKAEAYWRLGKALRYLDHPDRMRKRDFTKFWEDELGIHKTKRSRAELISDWIDDVDVLKGKGVRYALDLVQRAKDVDAKLNPDHEVMKRKVDALTCRIKGLTKEVDDLAGEMVKYHVPQDEIDAAMANYAKETKTFFDHVKPKKKAAA